MKRMMMTMAMMVAIAASAAAMPYGQAKKQALFLADKMAYELNLTDEQYEAAYEINLDYLMQVDNERHVYGSPWTRRNSLLNVILSPWQYAAYAAADYFYRPLRWANNVWNWGIYNRYNASRYYRAQPKIYVSYRGGRPANYYSNRTWYKPGKARTFEGRKFYKEREKEMHNYDKQQRKWQKEERKAYKNDRVNNGRGNWKGQGRW